MTMFYGFIRNFNHALEVMANLIIVSILWCICSLGIITILPASNALYKTVEQTIKYQDAYPVKIFFSNFKKHIGKKLIMGVVVSLAGILICAVISCADFMYTTAGSNAFFSAFSRIVMVYYISLLSYMIPGLDSGMSIRKQIVAGMYHCVKNLPFSLSMISTVGLGVLLVIMMPVSLLIVPGIIGLSAVYLVGSRI